MSNPSSKRIGSVSRHRIVPYQPDWPDRFDRLSANLRQALPADSVIEHYGSTSVPHLGSRPIVDIQIAVSDVTDRTLRRALEQLGYAQFSPPDLKILAVEGMLIFVPADGSNSVHLAVCERGGFHQRRQLAVRDYLRAYPNERAAYEEAKRRSAEAAQGDRARYAAGKAAFLSALQERALRWQRLKS